MDDEASDIETIRNTLEQLEGGTSEGFEQIEGAIEDAESITTEVFESDDQELDEIQGESQEFGNEINESKEVSESDLATISDASAEFKTDNPDKEFLHAKEEAIRDIDLLKEQEERERLAREESDAIQEQLKARVQKRAGR